MSYPLAQSFPAQRAVPSWLHTVRQAFADVEDRLDSRRVSFSTRRAEEALELVRPALIDAGFQVSPGKRASVSMHRGHDREGNVIPGHEVDAFHPTHKVVLEIDAGRAAQSNTGYRAILNGALLEDADHLVLAVPISYRYQNNGREAAINAYDSHVELAREIYRSHRLALPFRTLTVFGW
ncbi:hypothetical protein L332_08010 [Agrococcus pavilionensis RW1]|uniref:Uncharacterized protein n=1 Tax=Agrococcus pavilionensis RW1 TaxID=1330458 RepID=U1LBB4_9MICO|nr:hypothetical protein [Agrococcus pavilionensis]ERG64393.1 hypothetical protein L332_08010 [Agrococcus pavilionensis RW1]